MAAVGLQGTLSLSVTAGTWETLAIVPTDMTAMRTRLSMRLQVKYKFYFKSIFYTNHDLPDCPVATNLKDKLSSFLAEGLLDPLLPNILIQPEQDTEVKVSPQLSSAPRQSLT